MTIELRVEGLEDEELGGATNLESRDEGEFTIVEIVDRYGTSVPINALQIRLQTLPLDEGFWLDTGIVYYDD